MKLKVLSLFSGTASFTAGFDPEKWDIVHLDLYEEPDPGTPGKFLKMDIKQFAKDPAGWLDKLVAPGWRPDVVIGGSECTAFSRAGKHSKEKGSTRWKEGNWPAPYGPRLPTDQTARIGCSLPIAFWHIVRVLNPDLVFHENPVGGMLTMGFGRPEWIKGFTDFDVEQKLLSYCRYGDDRRKETCVWTNAPDSVWKPRDNCFNASPKRYLFENGTRLPLGSYVKAQKGDIIVHTPFESRPANGLIRVEGPDGKPCHVAAPRGARTGTQGIKGARDRGRVPYELSREIAEACEKALL